MFIGYFISWLQKLLTPAPQSGGTPQIPAKETKEADPGVELAKVKQM